MDKQNEIAVEYDLFKMAVPHHDDFQKQVGVELSKHFAKMQNPTILEIGSGTGITTQEILQAVPRATVTALDLESTMQDQAKTKNIPGNIEYVSADVRSFYNRWIPILSILL